MYVVYRDTRSFEQLCPGVAESSVCGLGPWQVWRVLETQGQLPETFLTDLRAVTGGPVLAADVWDSDAALVTALPVDGPAWVGWLNVDAAVSHSVQERPPFDEDDNYLGDGWVDPQYPPRAAAERERLLAWAPGSPAGLHAWALAAGLSPAPAEVLAATINTEETFIEERFFPLLEQLGLEFEDPPRPLAPVDVLRAVISHRLVATAEVAHDKAPDLVLTFDGAPSFRMCRCNHTVEFWPADDLEPTTDGRLVTDAATTGERYGPFLSGVAFRYGDVEEYLTFSAGGWTVGPTLELGKRNHWLVAEF